jgi:hypothetical protein
MRRVLTVALLCALASCATHPVLPPGCEEHLVPINPPAATGDHHETRPGH